MAISSSEWFHEIMSRSESWMQVIGPGQTVCLFLVECNVDGRMVLTTEWRNSIMSAAGSVDMASLARAVGSTLANCHGPSGYVSYFEACIRRMKDEAPEPPVPVRFVSESSVKPDAEKDYRHAREAKKWVRPEVAMERLLDGLMTTATLAYVDLEGVVQVHEVYHHVIIGDDGEFRSLCGRNGSRSTWWENRNGGQRQCAHCGVVWEKVLALAARDGMRVGV